MSTVTIVQGEDRTLTFQIKEIDASEVTTYMDLTNATGIEIRAAGTSVNYISFSFSSNEIVFLEKKSGTFKLIMSDAKTKQLKVGPNQNLEVIVDLGAPPLGERRVAQLIKSITVVKRIFPD